MVVIYASWRVHAHDRQAYDRWFTSLVELCQREPGCLTYEYFVNPLHPDRGYNLEVWRDQAALAAHLLSPAHVEIVRDNSGRWGSHGFECDFWDLADGHRSVRVASSLDTIGIHGLDADSDHEAQLAALVGGRRDRSTT